MALSDWKNSRTRVKEPMSTPRGTATAAASRKPTVVRNML